MNNKKSILIIILAIILAFLASNLVFKSSKKDIKTPNNIIEEIVEPDLEIKQEEVKKDIQNATQKPNQLIHPTKTDIPKIEPIQLPFEEDFKAIEPLKKEEEHPNEIIIREEYKIKSPSRYTFK